MGVALGAALARIGESVQFASRKPGREIAPGVKSCAFDDLATADLIVLATLWEDTRSLLGHAPPLEGKVVMSCVNSSTRDTPITVGLTNSAAEEIARWAPGARVVEAFNGTYAEAVDLAPNLPERQTVLYCGDDREARDTIGSLIRRLGFDALDAGPLRSARFLEPLAQLVVYLVRQAGYGPMGIHHVWPRAAL